MKRWTIQFTLHEGSDEFWESNPDYQKVCGLIQQALIDGYVEASDVSVTKFIDQP